MAGPWGIDKMEPEFPAASIYLDPDRRPPCVQVQYINALREHGLDELQAAFVARVMYLGSVFLPGHADAWLSQNTRSFSLDAPAHQRRSLRTRFLQALFISFKHLLPIAKRYTVPNLDLQYGRVESRYYYRLVGLENSRYARVTETHLAVARLMLFDYHVKHPEFTWYGGLDQKLDLFNSLGIPQSVFPVHTYTSADKAVPSTVVYFPDHRPIGVSDWRLCFPFAASIDTAQGVVEQVVKSHGRLFDALRARGLQVTAVLCIKRGVAAPTGLEQHVAPVQESDHYAFLRCFWKQLMGLAREAKDRRLIDAQGGKQAVSNRVRAWVREDRNTPTFDGRVPDLVIHECTDITIVREG